MKQCKCSPLQREAYVGKISGPLMDRTAIHVTVQPVDVEMWVSRSRGMTSDSMRAVVMRAREIQAERVRDVDGVDSNARLPDGLFPVHCAMEPAAEQLFIRAQQKHLVSARARTHIIRVARTIADLEASNLIAERHIMEAVGYRGRDSR